MIKPVISYSGGWWRCKVRGFAVSGSGRTPKEALRVFQMAGKK